MLYCKINIKRVEEKNIVAKFKKVLIEQQDTHTCNGWRRINGPLHVSSIFRSKCGIDS